MPSEPTATGTGGADPANTGAGGAAQGVSSADAALPSAPDAGAGGCATFVMPDDCSIEEGAVLPRDLRCTGLYADWEARELYCGIQSYAPAFALWSDAAEKVRYVWLPPGEAVDVTDPDDFRYPVGTQFWKEFYVPQGDTTRLGETRLMRRVAAGWLYTSYVWSPDGSEAVQQNDGVADLHGSGHVVPSRDQCKECHAGRPDFILGWDGLLLGSGAEGLTREALLAQELITWDGKSEGAANPLQALEIPGDAVERAALGYLHVNCGASCHNDTARALALESGFFMRLDSELLGSVQVTPTFATGYNRTPDPNAPLMDLAPPQGGGAYVDLLPLDPERSLTLVRMQIRDNDAAMPRMGSSRVDAEGVALVRAWIESMTPERGYPAATSPTAALPQ